MLRIGIDLGGTGIKTGLVDENGSILCTCETPTLAKRHYSEVIRDMADCALKLLDKAHVTLSDIASVGVGVPGVYDAKTGIILCCPNLGWRQVPFKKEFTQYINLPLYVDNDATVAGYAEYVAGSSKGTENSLFLTLGTGVGGGIILNGKPFSGSHGLGGEVGHVIFRLHGDKCSCGNEGCLERYCSATALINMAKAGLASHPDSAVYAACEGDPERINAKIVFDAAKAGDTFGLALFNEYVNNLAQAIGSLMQIFDPEMVVLGGGVSKAGTFLTDELNRQIPNYLLYKDAVYGSVTIASLGADAGIIGAAMLGK